MYVEHSLIQVYRGVFLACKQPKARPCWRALTNQEGVNQCLIGLEI